MKLSALHYAALRGNTQTCAALVQLGASVDAGDKMEQTPLHYAAQNGHADTCQLLLLCGASVDATDTYGKTPIVYAAQNGQGDSCKVLLDRGANLEIDMEAYAGDDGANPVYAPPVKARYSNTERSRPLGPAGSSMKRLGRKFLTQGNHIGEELPKLVGAA
jgi:ankyrin repeat protein